MTDQHESDAAFVETLHSIAGTVSAEIGQRFGQDIGRIVLWRVREAIEAALARRAALASMPPARSDAGQFYTDHDIAEIEQAAARAAMAVSDDAGRLRGVREAAPTDSVIAIVERFRKSAAYQVACTMDPPGVHVLQARVDMCDDILAELGRSVTPVRDVKQLVAELDPKLTSDSAFSWVVCLVDQAADIELFYNSAREDPEAYAEMVAGALRGVEVVKETRAAILDRAAASQPPAMGQEATSEHVCAICGAINTVCDKCQGPNGPDAAPEVRR